MKFLLQLHQFNEQHNQWPLFIAILVVGIAAALRFCRRNN